jgi:predicted RNA-binding protein YlxR (DUF448 family)
VVGAGAEERAGAGPGTASGTAAAPAGGRPGRGSATGADKRRAAVGGGPAGTGGGGASIAPALHSEAVRRPGRKRASPNVDPREGPIRTCVGCRTRVPADDLLRVVAVDGVLIPDPRRRLPGRGAWLHPVPECLTRAERRSAFPRALRVPGPLDAGRVRSHVRSCAPADMPAEPGRSAPSGTGTAGSGPTGEHHR